MKWAVAGHVHHKAATSPYKVGGCMDGKTTTELFQGGIQGQGVGAEKPLKIHPLTARGCFKNRMICPEICTGNTRIGHIDCMETKGKTPAADKAKYLYATA